MAAVRVSASIVVYGGFEEASATVESILAHTKAAPLQLFVIDNASPDGAGEKLKARFAKECTVLCLPQNVGFGKGNNACIPYLESDIHFVINPDILLESDVLSDMAGYLQAHPEVAIANTALRFPNGEEQHTAKNKPTFMGLLARQVPGKAFEKYERSYLRLDDDLSIPTEVEFCSGCFFAIRTEVFRQIGGFDPAYFMYVEDADITQEAKRHGKAMFLPQFTVTHAWHRDARKKFKNFAWQVSSMLRYWKKWGFRFK